MRRISTLFQTIKDLNKDRWVRKYNPHEQFFVDRGGGILAHGVLNLSIDDTFYAYLE